VTGVGRWRLLGAAVCASVADHATRAAMVLDGTLSRAEVRAALSAPAAVPLHLVAAPSPSPSAGLLVLLAARRRADAARAEARAGERRCP
jgi:hypothetical protein